MNARNTSDATGEPVDPDLQEQAKPGHGVPSQDPDPKAQVALTPEEAERERGSVAVGGGAMAGAATGAAVGAAVAGPVGVLVGGAIGTVAGALGGEALGQTLEKEEERKEREDVREDKLGKK